MKCGVYVITNLAASTHREYMTNKLITLSVAAVATLTLAVPAYAQSGSSTSAGATIAVQGGGLTSVTDLNDAKSADFKTGFNVGGSLGYDFNPYLGLRATYTFGRAEARGAALPAAFPVGTKTNRQYYGAELKLSAPGPISPYLLVGGGAVTIKPDTTPSSDSFTKPAGKAGVGVSFALPSNVSVFAEGSGWLYKFEEFGFDKAQFDLTWSAGLSYRFGR
jgi:opacity protein-like surface antigen